MPLMPFAVCADEIGIAHKLLILLPGEWMSNQYLLRTIYSIAFRLQIAVELPDELRNIAYQALFRSMIQIRALPAGAWQVIRRR